MEILPGMSTYTKVASLGCCASYEKVIRFFCIDAIKLIVTLPLDLLGSLMTNHLVLLV